MKNAESGSTRTRKRIIIENRTENAGMNKSPGPEPKERKPRTANHQKSCVKAIKKKNLTEPAMMYYAILAEPGRERTAREIADNINQCNGHRFSNPHSAMRSLANSASFRTLLRSGRGTRNAPYKFSISEEMAAQINKNLKNSHIITLCRSSSSSILEDFSNKFIRFKNALEITGRMRRIYEKNNIAPRRAVPSFIKTFSGPGQNDNLAGAKINRPLKSLISCLAVQDMLIEIVESKLKQVNLDRRKTPTLKRAVQTAIANLQIAGKLVDFIETEANLT